MLATIPVLLEISLGRGSAEPACTPRSSFCSLSQWFHWTWEGVKRRPGLGTQPQDSCPPCVLTCRWQYVNSGSQAQGSCPLFLHPQPTVCKQWVIATRQVEGFRRRSRQGQVHWPRIVICSLFLYLQIILYKQWVTEVQVPTSSSSIAKYLLCPEVLKPASQHLLRSKFPQSLKESQLSPWPQALLISLFFCSSKLRGWTPGMSQWASQIRYLFVDEFSIGPLVHKNNTGASY